MDSRLPHGALDEAATRKLVQLARDTRPDGEHLNETQLRDWATAVLDRSGLRYTDAHVDKLVPLLATIAARTPAMRGNRRARRAQMRAGKRQRW